MYARLATLKGEDVVRYSFHEMHPQRTRITLEQLPEKLVHRGVEALVIDTVHFFAELVPINMCIPYAHIWNVLHIDYSGATPPCLFGWDHEDTPVARARNMEAVKKMSSVFQPIQQVARSWAENHGLQIDWNTPNATISKLAAISQTPKEFDFPDVPQPPAFHYAGPFHDDDGRERVAFPWERLTGEPLIYASMGTLVNGLTDVFRIILKAAAAITGRQLVLSIGSNIQMDDIGPIPASAIVVSTAPQIELLKRAELCITHAGINTTLESLALGVPMVAIPVGFDQPGIAARIAHHGTGEFIQLDELTTERLRGLIEKVLQDPSYRERAHYFQRVISKTRGLDVAADIIEQTFHKYQTEVPRENRSVA
jgi:MGT family glycosyltransferase